MLPRDHPDRIDVAFDDHRLVANAGLLDAGAQVPLVPLGFGPCRQGGCHPVPASWTAPNWLTDTSTWATGWAEPTPATR